MKYNIKLLNKTLKLSIGLIILFQLILSIALPLVQDQNDSASYYMNVHYVHTGHFIVEDLYPSFKLPSQAYPFYGYSVALYICKTISEFLHINWTTLVKGFQFLAYALTSFLFVKITLRVSNSGILSYLIGISYLLYYPHFKFANLVMSETYAIFVLALCILIFLKNISEFKPGYSILLFLLCGHLILIKPVFLLIVLLFILYQIVVSLKSNNKFASLSAILFICIFPVLQILFSLNYFGNMQIRPGLGRNLWNRVISHDRLIPIHSRKLIEIDSVFASHQETVPLDNWWSITKKLSQFGYSENETIEICGAIAIDGIKENPVKYILNTFSNSYENYNYGSVNGHIYCSPKEYQSAIQNFNYDRNHTPLVNELLKQSFNDNKATVFIQKLNCNLAEFSSGFYYLYHNVLIIVLFILSGFYYTYNLIKSKFDKKPVMHFTMWWCAFSIVIGSNLMEYPQSRLILPAVMYVIIAVAVFISGIGNTICKKIF